MYRSINSLDSMYFNAVGWELVIVFGGIQVIYYGIRRFVLVVREVPILKEMIKQFFHFFI